MEKLAAHNSMLTIFCIFVLCIQYPYKNNLWLPYILLQKHLQGIVFVTKVDFNNSGKNEFYTL